MIATIIPIHEFSKAEEAYECIRKAHEYLRKELTGLEEQPRHLISHESIVIAEKTEVLKQIEMAMAKLVALSKVSNAQFATTQDVNSAISASQPYNPGSRENY
jgi:hypothetical protein